MINLQIDRNLYNDFEYKGDKFRIICFCREKDFQNNKDSSSAGRFFLNEFSYKTTIYAQNLTRNRLETFPLHLLNQEQKLKLKEKQ